MVLTLGLLGMLMALKEAGRASPAPGGGKVSFISLISGDRMVESREGGRKGGRKRGR